MHPDGRILQRGPPVAAARIVSSSYFGVLGLLVLGLLVLLPGVLLGDVVLLPLVAPPLLLPLVEALDLKCASHSEREICPSLFVSTAEKVGAELLDAPPLGMPEDPDELEDGVADVSELLLPEAPVDDEPELCAMDTPAIAKSAAAVAVPTNLNIWTFLLHKD